MGRVEFGGSMCGDPKCTSIHPIIRILAGDRVLTFMSDGGFPPDQIEAACHMIFKILCDPAGRGELDIAPGGRIIDDYAVPSNGEEA